ncbi:MAG TPA: L-rhamnose/proton symporter RhaT [Planctomycetota bacterium]|nr:L-rhamnose/proton symporter RhaT [Planctomycetota bacterium]
MEIWLGFLFLFLGAACGGSFGLPSKFVRKDTPWEVLWGPFFFFVTVLLPVVVGPAVVEDFFGVYGNVAMAKLLPVLIFGFLWGLGSMTLGLSFAFIGLSLAYALNYGAQIVTGSLLPMALFNPKDMATEHGAVILAGVGVCVVGVIVAARAAMLKEASAKAAATPDETAGAQRPRMLIGVLVGVVSGVLCACWAVASGYAGPVAKAAEAAGNKGVAVAWAVTCLILWGGVLSACGYCACKLTKNKTWGHLFQPGVGRTLCLAFAMALLHDAAVFFFALGWGRLGSLGVPVGYPAFMSFAIIIGNLHGFRTGEWKGASKRSVQWIVAAIVVLILGVVVLAQGNAMAERARHNAASGAAAQPVLKAKEAQ